MIVIEKAILFYSERYVCVSRRNISALQIAVYTIKKLYTGNLSKTQTKQTQEQQQNASYNKSKRYGRDRVLQVHKNVSQYITYSEPINPSIPLLGALASYQMRHTRTNL